jgi:hypothetical protein
VAKLVSTGAGNYARVRNAQRTWYPIEVLAVSRIFAALFFRSDGSLRTNQSEHVGDQLIGPFARGMVIDDVDNQHLVRFVLRSDGLDAILNHLRRADDDPTLHGQSTGPVRVFHQELSRFLWRRHGYEFATLETQDQHFETGDKDISLRVGLCADDCDRVCGTRPRGESPIGWKASRLLRCRGGLFSQEASS